ncbi:zinc metallopeptidase [Kouleothrix aurantiaca]|uniref:Zinc metallopeptidase n=1 Tax=Kouleothrix aurantiaca TaxID=186479 RepID=A0A0P9F5V2_9CHLR|nr:zinc metallopeptidase [Kouleothrix aurantiaca]
MPFLFFNFQYLIFMLPAIGLALFAQWKVKSTYQKFSQVRNMQNMTGADVARVLMRNEGLDYVQVEMIPGDLTDHYDPRGKIMRLSAGSSQTPSVAAMAVVAHELGHAMQDKQGYFWLQLRSGIVGIANIGSSFGTILVFIGLMFGAAAGRGGNLGFTIAVAGLILMSAAVFFSLITLPVELNASSRAREMLMRNGLVTTQEAQGVSSMLNAAALTYIAGAAQAVLQLLYFASIIFGGRRRG